MRRSFLALCYWCFGDALLTVTSSDKSDTFSKVDVGTLATWRAAGISTRQLHSLVSSGQLVKVRHGAYAPGAC
ncbi:MAG: type IV toxin-antitoxin system AbiEi family antitoxin domain-containing protein [Trebonia sp.]